MTLDRFVAWLADSPVSVGIGAHAWITPAVQTVHILAIAVLMSLMLMIALRALGVLGEAQPVAAFARVYVPRMGAALVVLLLSGATLIVGEPRRSLENPVFVLKMGLLAVALLLGAGMLLPLRIDEGFWSPPLRRRALQALAAVSLVAWTAIVFAGRWIAYAIT